ncbi:MAG TPA: hypothetical protein VFQ38_13300 [Longimicrobiales bacterium]|nr:hypothetical protein [Longimicrobiales bacterium]
MRRILLPALAILLAAPSVVAQQPAPPKPMSAAAKIANAQAAAPAALAAAATIMDWPATPRGKPTELRKGTNGWVCFPDDPSTQGNDPICADPTWQAWFDAYMKKQPPRVQRVGISYMMAPGGAFGSNTDPFATKATPTNQWGFDGPHLMVLVPNTASLQGLPTTRQSSAPYVMWSGTPYAHLMVPVATPRH